MTEQPAEHGAYNIQLSSKQAALAMGLYLQLGAAVDDMVVRLGDDMPSWDRVQVEDQARRLVMSGCLCKVVGVGPKVDARLFTMPEWQELLGRLLHLHDTTDLNETEEP